MSCARACHGQTSRPNGSAAPGSPAGGGFGTEPRPGYGPACMRPCSSSCDVPARWTWTTARLTVRTSDVRALKGGAHTGPSPVDRSRSGSKHHVIVDRQGTSLTGDNRHDVTQLIPLLDAIPPGRSVSARNRRSGAVAHQPSHLNMFPQDMIAKGVHTTSSEEPAGEFPALGSRPQPLSACSAARRSDCSPRRPHPRCDPGVTSHHPDQRRHPQRPKRMRIRPGFDPRTPDAKTISS